MAAESGTCSTAAEERRRIARELHDCPAQVLSAGHLRLRALDVHPELDDAPLVRAELNELADIFQEALVDVRENIAALKLAADPSASLQESVGRSVRRLARCSSVCTQLSLGPGIPELPETMQLHVLRIAQEALTNVRKHARAHSVKVSLRRESAWLVLEITDDGRGFTPTSVAARDTFGITSMRERTAILGGAFTLTSDPGTGTRLRVDVPLDPASLARAGDRAPHPSPPRPEPML